MEVISISVRSKPFWEIKDVISFSNAKVHFSGLGDFEIDDMDRGIQMDGFEDVECDGMCVKVIDVNILTDWCVVGMSEVEADKVEVLTEEVEWSDDETKRGREIL